MNYLYKITNLINNKIYIGVHKTSDINDGYMGSGKIIKSAIEKYGIENFRKDILEYFDTYEMAFLREAEIVNDKFLLREDVYNLRLGGSGGFDYINKSGIAKFRGKKHSSESKKCMAHIHTDDERLFNRNRMLGNNLNPNIKLTGINHPASYNKSEDHKTKISDSIEKLHLDGIYKNSPVTRTGKDHPQFGRMWITNGTENKKIKNSDIIPNGWYKGRNIK